MSLVTSGPSLRTKTLFDNSYLIIFIACLVTVLNFVPCIWFTFLFVELRRDFNATAVSTGWLGSLMWTTSFALSPVSAVLEEHLGVKLVALLGTAFSSVSFFVSSYVPDMIWLFITIGVFYGFSMCILLHSSLRMFCYLFNENKSQRALSLLFAGPYLGALFGNGFIQNMFTENGWRVTLRYLSAAMSSAVPLVFLFYRNHHQSEMSIPTSPSTHISGDELTKRSNPALDDEPKCQDNPSFISDGSRQNDLPLKSTEGENLRHNTVQVDKESWVITKPRNNVRQDHQRLKTFIKSLNTWMLGLSLFLTFSAISIYQVNIVSHYRIIESLTANDVWLLMTVTNVFDIISRLAVFIAGGRFLCRPVTFIILVELLLGVVSSVYSVVTSLLPLLILSSLQGFCRSAVVVMSFAAAVDLLSSDVTDYVITLVMYGQGVGYLVGALPAGAIFDVTGSYTLAFLLVALLFGLSSGILIFLHITSSRRRRKRKISASLKGNKGRQPGISLISFKSETMVNSPLDNCGHQIKAEIV